MQLDILHLQGAGLAMPSKLAGRCHHALDEIISNLQQHLGKTKVWESNRVIGRVSACSWDNLRFSQAFY